MPPLALTPATPTALEDSRSRPSPTKRRRLDLDLGSPRLLDDRLGKLIASSAQCLASSSTWTQFVQSSRPHHHLSATVQKLPHRAAPLLDQLRNQGAPVVFSTPAWTPERLQACLDRGPHSSARDHAAFVRDEMADFVEKGFWTVLPYRLVQHLPNLRLSPLGVVPQRDRRPRLIVDLSFYDVNAETIPHAPPEAMQFGRTLDRLLAKARHADPAYGPVHMLKVDIADGFYRVGLDPDQAPGLAVILPKATDEEQLVAIPFVLPMGWVESPPFFCIATETAADLANARRHRPTAPAHRLEAIADTPPEAPPVYKGPPPVALSPSSLQPLTQPVRSFDVYVDDFLALGQGTPSQLKTLRRHLLHSIDAVFAPLAAADTHGNEAISVKKLRKGDGSWSTLKVVLGWLLDTIHHTISLPPHRAQRLLHIFDELRDRHRVSVKKWHRVLGELRSMVLAIPGGKGLFSTLQHGLKFSDKHRVRLSPSIRSHLDDFESLAQSLAARPTHFAEIVPDLPTCIGACDASLAGMGGVWFLPDGRNLVWRHDFPPDIRRSLITADHLSGSITNSDLELAGIIAHQDVLAQHVALQHTTVALLNDNYPALVRCVKGSVTSDAAAAYLLRVNSMHQRHHRYLAVYDHINGPSNSLSTAATLDVVSPTARHEFGADLRLAQATTRTAVVPQRANARDYTWSIWETYCASLGISPFLEAISDPIPYLQVFAQRYRDGRLSKSTHGVRSRTVEQALRDIGQTLASLGAPDPRLDGPRALDLRLTHQLRAYGRIDDPPTRVQPAPLQLLQHLHKASIDTWSRAVCDMAFIGFFFLCRPGEYTCASDPDSSPFRLCDVTFYHGPRAVPATTGTLGDISSATSVYLTFTDQKNGVRGERIGHCRSQDATACPVLALVRRVLHLRAHHAPPTSPLYLVHTANRFIPIRSSAITQALRVSASATTSSLNIDPSRISARSLRAGGAMALLCAGIDTNIIRLVGRWRSDEMLRYLHVQALPHTTNLAAAMVQHGAFSLLPHQPFPAAAIPILGLAPAA